MKESVFHGRSFAFKEILSSKVTTSEVVHSSNAVCADSNWVAGMKKTTLQPLYHLHFHFIAWLATDAAWFAHQWWLI